jgi:hypothetical protein
LTLTRIDCRSDLYEEQKANDDEHHRNTEVHMLRMLIETTAEITSLFAFGTMVAIWAMILGTMA